MLARVFNVNLIAGAVLLLVSGATHGVWPARAGVGAAIIVADVLVVWLTLRHLPGGARRHLRGLPRRMTTRQRVVGVALVLGTLGLLALAFIPASTPWLRPSRSMVAVLVIRAVIWMVIAGRRQRD